MARGCFGEHIHGKALILSAVFIDNALRDTHGLKFGHARPNLLDHLLGGQVSDAVAFAKAGDLIVRLNQAQFHHDFVSTHNFGLRESGFDPLHGDDRGVQIGGHADAQFPACDTNRLEHIVESIRYQFWVGRVGAFPVFHQHKELVQAVAVTREMAALRPAHQRRVSGGGYGHARALKQRPEAGEVTGIGIVGLIGVDDQSIQAFAAQDGGRALYALQILVFGDMDCSVARHISSS